MYEERGNHVTVGERAMMRDGNALVYFVGESTAHEGPVKDTIAFGPRRKLNLGTTNRSSAIER